MYTPPQLQFVTIDVFTSKPYKGNPLAIVRIPHGTQVSQEQKQAIAREFNLSETTFLHENGEKAKEKVWTVDIFMTTQEVPFAGHPMIGTACYVLSREAQETGEQDGIIEANFKLQAGPVSLRYDIAKGTVRAAIPHDVHIHKKSWTKDELFKEQPRLADAHQQGKIQVKDEYAIVSIVNGMTFVLVELDSLEALGLVTLAGKSLKVDGLDEGWDKTFIGTYFYVRTGKSEGRSPTVRTRMAESQIEEPASGNAAADLAAYLSLTGKSKGGATTLRARMIEGSLEDPATGSAASDLAAYLSLKARKSNETLSYEIVQGVEMGRQSEIFIDVEMAEDNTLSKVYLEGGAVQVMEGRLTV